MARRTPVGVQTHAAVFRNLGGGALVSEADDQMVGVSSAFKAACHMLQRVAPTKAAVLFTGESGVGKEMFASTLHRISPRAAKPFVAQLSCSVDYAQSFPSPPSSIEDFTVDEWDSGLWDTALWDGSTAATTTSRVTPRRPLECVRRCANHWPARAVSGSRSRWSSVMGLPAVGKIMCT